LDEPEIPLYPLRFEPIYQYRLWGGRRLGTLLSARLPGDGPLGEAWLLSDRADCSSVVAEGALIGRTISQLLQQSPQEFMGRLSGQFSRFPLLLKFLDVGKTLSVQVHPADAQTDLIPPGNTGKTEAWVVLEKGPQARIYAGLKRESSTAAMRQAIDAGELPDQLAGFTPEIGDAVLVRAGSVHSLRDVVVFEVQENSDVTYRLYDWDQIDPRTGQRRPLQVDQAMACIDFNQRPIQPVPPVVEMTKPVLRERLVLCDHFAVSRVTAGSSFSVGVAGLPRVLVCLAGKGLLQHASKSYSFGKGDVLLLPAVLGPCLCRPAGTVTVLELSLPGDT
jgi:mannose-6-phosphate isomerase